MLFGGKEGHLTPCGGAFCFGHVRTAPLGRPRAARAARAGCDVAAVSCSDQIVLTVGDISLCGIQLVRELNVLNVRNSASTNAEV